MIQLANPIAVSEINTCAKVGRLAADPDAGTLTFAVRFGSGTPFVPAAIVPLITVEVSTVSNTWSASNGQSASLTPDQLAVQASIQAAVATIQAQLEGLLAVGLTPGTVQAG